jgi:alcohol dehydrogenase class IV
MPTNAGSGSEVNQYGSVFDPGTRRKIRASDYRALPRITVLDPVLTVSLNVLQTASTGANALSHCFEAVYSRARHPLSTAFARQGASLIGAALPRCVAEPDNLKAREDQLMGSVLSSLGFSNSMLGLNSAFGHSLGAVGGMTVALGNYIMLPISLRHNAAYAPREIVEVGTEMGLAKPGTPASQAAAAQVADEVGRWLHAMAGELRLRDFVPGGRAGLVEVSIHCVPDVCLPYNPGPQPDQSTLLRLLEQAW